MVNALDEMRRVPLKVGVKQRGRTDCEKTLFRTNEIQRAVIVVVKFVAALVATNSTN